MAYPTSADIDAAIPVDGEPSRALTNAAIKSIASESEAAASKLATINSGATANSPDATLLDRANHTGTQTADTISDLPEVLDGIANKVKASNTDETPSFLDGKTDGVTVVIESNKLVVKDVDGLTIGIADLNTFLSGTDGNIQNQINSLSDTITGIAGGMVWKGKVETHADLLAVTTMVNGDVILVLADESRAGGRSLYVYSETLGAWDFIGEFTFSDSFIALQDTPGNYTGHDGKVVKVDETNEQVVFDSVTWSELQDKPTSAVSDIDLAVNQRHTHDNKSVLDKFGENAEGDPTFDGAVLGGGGTQPTTERQYLNVSRSTNQTNVRSNDPILFNDTHAVRGITYNQINGQFTLEAGKVYDITVSLKLGDFVSWAPFEIYNASFGYSMFPKTQLIASSRSSNFAASGVLSLIIAPLETAQFFVRFGTLGTNENGVTVEQNESSLKIVEI